MRRASTFRLLLLPQLSRSLPFSRRLQAAALSSSSPSPQQHAKDESKSDGTESEREGTNYGHRWSPSERHPQPRLPRRHWLDRRAPAAAEWLDSQARELWLRGLEERCRRIPELAGHELLLRRVVSERAEALARRLVSSGFLDEKEGEEEGKPPPNTATSSRARTHLQAASLLRATGDALLPFFRGDERRVLEVLKDAAGRGPRLSGLLAAALRLQARLAALVPPSVASSSFFPPAWAGRTMAEERLRLLLDDHGGAWPGAEVVSEVFAEEREEEEDDGGGGGGGGEGRGFFASLVPSFLLLRGGSGSPSASSSAEVARIKTTTTLRVPRCLYHEMMAMATSDGEGEGSSSSPSSPSSSSSPRRPRWLEACCCSVDGVWFEPWRSSGGNSGEEEEDGLSLSALATRGSLRGSLVSFRRRRWLGDDSGAACELCVTRVEAVGPRR